MSSAVAEGASDDVAVSAPARVTGTDPLTLSVVGAAGPVTVTLTDATGATSRWRFGRAAAPTLSLSLDLDGPDEGAAPRNGAASVAIVSPVGVVAETSTTIDRSPPTPALTPVVQDDRVGLLWDAVAAAGPVTYRLERAGVGSTWTTLADGPDVGYTDRNLEPGRYRYRLTAAIPGANGPPNWSAPTATQVRIAPPPPPPPPPTQAPQPADQPTRAPAPRPREVKATGQVRGPINPGPPRQSDGGPRTASSPAVGVGAQTLQSGAPAIAAPEVTAPIVAAPAPSSWPTAPAFEPFPVVVPPSGALAVSAGAARAPDAVTLSAGFGFLVIAAAAAELLRRRARRGRDHSSGGRSPVST